MADEPGWLQRLGIAASSSKLGGILYHQVCRRIDTVLIPATGGRLAMGPPGQTVLITTTGARSGRPRKASLAFMWSGDDMVVIASKGGAPHHPGWYHNLKADPRVVVQYRGGTEERRGREAVGEEREALFKEMAATFSNFEAYQRRATGLASQTFAPLARQACVTTAPAYLRELDTHQTRRSELRRTGNTWTRGHCGQWGQCYQQQQQQDQPYNEQRPQDPDKAKGRG